MQNFNILAIVSVAEQDGLSLTQLELERQVFLQRGPNTFCFIAGPILLYSNLGLSEPQK